MKQKTMGSKIIPRLLKTEKLFAYLCKKPIIVFYNTMSDIPPVLHQAAAIIPAAGFSGRMGISKVALAFDQKRTFAEKIVESYLEAGVQQVVLVVNKQGKAALEEKQARFDETRVRIVLNAFPEKERFFSLQTGLIFLQDFRVVFLQNIDNPFVRPETLWQIAALYEPGSYVVPQYNGRGGHPVLLSQKIVSELVSFPDEKANLRDFLNEYQKIYCPVNRDEILININSPDSYRRYFNSPPR